MHFTDIFNKEFKTVLDENFSSIVTENVGPYLYFLVKTIRPKTILEIGAGYSSIFFAKALSDIESDNNFDKKLIGSKNVPNDWTRRYQLLNHSYDFNQKSKLYIIDNFSKKKHDTARPIDTALKSLSLNKFVKFFNTDAMNLQKVEKIIKPIQPLDLVFLDFGAGVSLPIFFKFFYEYLNSRGGYIMVHSTLTNALHRLWLSELKLNAKNDNSMEIMSFFEPNKSMQNSFTLVKKNLPTKTGQYFPPIITAAP